MCAENQETCPTHDDYDVDPVKQVTIAETLASTRSRHLLTAEE